jgi:hypothetical protein
MTQYIGQITVILESDTTLQASETLCVLAKKLNDSCPEVVFADHNGDIEDNGKVERECEESLTTEAAATPATTDIDIPALLAERRQIAVIWCIEDVQEVRPDLTEGQSWEVLQATKRYHDATIGINWDVLDCHADLLFGSAPATDKAEEE